MCHGREILKKYIIFKISVTRNRIKKKKIEIFFKYLLYVQQSCGVLIKTVLAITARV
mgnify:CR=1 FL=1